MRAGSKNKEEQQPEKLGHKEIIDFLVIKSSVRNFLKLGRKIRVSTSYWNYLTTVKRPSILELERDVKDSLKYPIEI
jgi:hypothetical protein